MSVRRLGGRVGRQGAKGTVSRTLVRQVVVGEKQIRPGGEFIIDYKRLNVGASSLLLGRMNFASARSLRSIEQAKSL